MRNEADGIRRHRPLRPRKQAANLAASPPQQRLSGLRPSRQRPRPIPPPAASHLTTPIFVQPKFSHRLNTAYRVSQPTDEKTNSKPPPGKAPLAPGGEGTAPLGAGEGTGECVDVVGDSSQRTRLLPRGFGIRKVYFHNDP